MTFPESCAPAIEALQRGFVADADTMPGLDRADSTVLIRRLLREAVVVPAEQNPTTASDGSDRGEADPVQRSIPHAQRPHIRHRIGGTLWAMLELCGAWGHSAFLDSPALLDRELGRDICRRIEAAGMRITAIRRPGRRPETPRWRWFIAQCDEGSEALYQGEVNEPANTWTSPWTAPTAN